MSLCDIRGFHLNITMLMDSAFIQEIQKYEVIYLILILNKFKNRNYNVF